MRASGSDCPTGKVQFANRDAAAESLHAQRAMGRTDGLAKSYRCPLCGCFHIGGTGRRRDKLRKRRGVR